MFETSIVLELNQLFKFSANFALFENFLRIRTYFSMCEKFVYKKFKINQRRHFSKAQVNQQSLTKGTSRNNVRTFSISSVLLIYPVHT